VTHTLEGRIAAHVVALAAMRSSSGAHGAVGRWRVRTAGDRPAGRREWAEPRRSMHLFSAYLVMTLVISGKKIPPIINAGVELTQIADMN